MKARTTQLIFCTIALALHIGVACSYCMAAKGGSGNGGGKPGGGDPPPSPSLPVTYTITAPTMPDPTFVFNDHNESGAVVGWNLGGAGPDGARPIVYLPEVSTSHAFYLDDPEIGLPELPVGYENWHARSAVAINNHGDIGGNIEPFSNVTNDSQAFVFVRSASEPELRIFDKLDPTADREFVKAFNDSGDTLIESWKTTSDGTEINYFVGNPGLYGNPQQTFTKIDFNSLGDYSRGEAIQLTNRIDGGQAIIAGSVTVGETSPQVFRMSFDGSDFEVFQDYQAEDGNYYSVTSLGIAGDSTDAGDVVVLGQIGNKPGGKGKSYGFPAVWTYNTGELTAVTGGDTEAAPWALATINNSGDAVLGDYQESLWHSDYSPTQGIISIAEAIDPNDPNRYLFEFGLEIADHGSTGWPTIFAAGEELVDGVSHRRLLILTPSLNATAITTSVPEPQTAILLTLTALSSLFTHRGQPRHEAITHRLGVD